MRLLGIDLETTGLDFKKDKIIEIGLVLKDWGVKKPLLQKAIFVYDDDYPAITDEVEAITGITQEILNEFGLSSFETLQMFLDILPVLKPDYIVAHNGGLFDKPFLKAKLEEFELKFPDIEWIDTRTDIIYSKYLKERSLMALGAAHGFLNPFSHDALSDVHTMFRVLECYDIEEVIYRSKEPTIVLEALVSFADKDLAKQRGYYWYPETKRWCKSFKESDIGIEKKEAPFKVREVEIDEIAG